MCTTNTLKTWRNRENLNIYQSILWMSGYLKMPLCSVTYPMQPRKTQRSQISISTKFTCHHQYSTSQSTMLFSPKKRKMTIRKLRSPSRDSTQEYKISRETSITSYLMRCKWVLSSESWLNSMILSKLLIWEHLPFNF